MKSRILLVAGTVWLGSVLNAVAASPDQLLPPDTLAVFAIPDCTAAGTAWKEQAIVRLWSDPSVRPFREKFEHQWRKVVIGPLEERLGMPLTNHVQLLEGQLTVALVGNGWPRTIGKEPAWLLALDSRDRAGELAERLGGWKTNLTAAGRQVRSEKIRELDFTVISIPRDERDESTGIEVWFGQSGSVLWLGSHGTVLEQALARQSGNGGPSLNSNPDFATAYGAAIGSAQAYGWVHLKPLVEFVSKMGEVPESPDGGALGLLQPSKLLPALGLQDLRSLSFAINSSTGGMTGELRIGVPESSRTGLFKMLLPGRNPAEPPAFVSDATTRFQRMRVDLREAWAALEGAVYSILPTARSVVDLMFQSVGKDQDPNYDLRRELIGNLGNDVIVLEERPATNTLEALSAPPTLILIGSKSPEKVAGALKTLATLLPPPMNVLRERETAGRTIYSLALPNEDGAGSNAPTKWFSFAAATNYLALSGDAGLLEGFLRGAEPNTKPLAAIEGLNEAARVVGGMESGWFGYENDKAMAQSILDALRKDTDSIERLLAFTPAGEAVEKSGGLKAWADFTLLPPFEQIANYFHFTVYGLDLGPEDFGYRMFSPTPPALKP
jgi:hypothetical protein